MATLQKYREEAVARSEQSSRDVSPTTRLPFREGDAAYDNAYVSSPLRSEQRLSRPEDRDFPSVPTTSPGRPLTSSGARLEPLTEDSFPFNAPTGTVGPTPTNDLHHQASRIGATVEQSPQATARRRPLPLGQTTPTDRRSVQFARSTGDFESAPTPLQKSTTWETDEESELVKGGRQGSFFGRLKALASPASSSHIRTGSNTTGIATPNGALSPQSERSEPTYPVSHNGESEMGADGDIEEESDEEHHHDTRPKRKRKLRRALGDGVGAGPATPMASRFASFIREHQLSSTGSRPDVKRRNTMSDVGEESRRAGVSEDEGKDKLRNAWRKGIENARGLSYARKTQEPETPGERRPMGLRRFTGALDTSSSPFRPRPGGDRQMTTSAARWKQIKTGLKMFAQRKQNERIRVDHQKSAQLMAQLMAGAPAALFFASMYQRDEHGHRKIPVLLEQLKINIPESHMREIKTGDRHMIFRIDLEYGNGPARLNWTIHRSLRDFINLHVKYKVQGQTEKFTQRRGEDKSKAKIPRFPKSAFPYARGVRGLFAGLEDEDDDEENEGSGADPDASGTERPGKHRRRRSSFVLMRRKSSLANANQDGQAGGTGEGARQKEHYQDRQRRKLETYLQKMIRWLIFRPDSTRLCKFLELSALAIRLSAEGGYQGKQGLLTIATPGQFDIRRKALTGVHSLKQRHKPRWTLVRHSYIVIVDGPESVVPYDVFLVDSDFAAGRGKKRLRDQTPHELAKTATDNTTPAKHHLIRLYNAERKLKLIAKNERQQLQFHESIDFMAKQTIWSKKQRFASYAPVRNNVWCRWLVDGRDHMWQVSRAIDNAKDFIYIHDWWLSPELYMRRPAAISQKWRLDRLLQRKAQEGVKIFVIVYRNIESAIPIDSEYTKWALLDLHENICIQRSPNQFRQNQFFWAHHEKLVVVDNMMAFVGGVDLCFGRWDEPCHSLTDDKLTGFELDHDIPRDSEHCQVWPGKDYSNPRVQDFYALDRPYEEMYDRTKVPRMPWHDIAMQIVGQPARDVGRHFVQRWNYILRQRVPSRQTPVLIPPPEYDQAELDRLGMTGSCTVQILRSCSPWSIGTPNKVEHSIMNAYCAHIESSEHFVYIENQFYISSCVVEGTQIHNKIGDALVERAMRAHANKERWQACLVIPLMPGFQNSVDSQDGTSIRLIMQCQYRSICRGDSSIFGRLRAVGIDPEDYIRFYSLRQWGKIGPRKCLTTEQLYIHAKCMVVDDRHVIIGSANINERSMLGSRDSEVAAVVTDTRMISSFMGGQPYMVGEFPHTLRMRLQREHLGIDVDAIYRREQAEKERHEQDIMMDHIYREDFGANLAEGADFLTPPTTPPPNALNVQNLQAADAAGGSGKKEDLQDWVIGAQTGATGSSDSPEQQEKQRNTADARHDLDVEGYGFDNEREIENAGLAGMRDTYVDSHGHEVLRNRDAPGAKRIEEIEKQLPVANEVVDDQKNMARPPWPMGRGDTYALGLVPRSQLPELPALDDTDIGGPPIVRTESKTSAKVLGPLVHNMRRPEVDEDCMKDPIVTSYYNDIWNLVAENNTKIYRQVFRCMPDSEVTDWKAYERFNEYNERFMQSQGLGASKPAAPKDAPDASGPPGSAGTVLSQGSEVAEKASAAAAKSKGMFGSLVNRIRPGSKMSNGGSATDELREKHLGTPEPPDSNEPTAVPSPYSEAVDEKENQQQEDGTFNRHRTITISDSAGHGPETTATASNNGPGLQHSTSQKRRRRAGTRSSAKAPPVEEVLGREESEKLLNLIQGHLVLWPYDWLEKEEKGGNWLYNIDQLAPLEIYD